MVGIIDGVDSGQISFSGCFSRKILPQIPKLGSQFLPFEICCPVQFFLGKIPAQIQEFPDAFCRLLPGKKGGSRDCGSFSLCNAEALRIIPDRIFLVVQIKARAVFAIMFPEKLRIFLHRFILHKMSTDYKAAA